MKHWKRIVDRQISDAIGNGDVSHLSGAGKKLPLKDDSGTPKELRAAFKIMDDHDVMPEWITAGRRLAQMEADLERQIRSRAQAYFREKRRARLEASATRAEQVESKWRLHQEQFLERVERYNRDVLVYNLKLPSGIPHKPILRGKALIIQALPSKG